MISALCHPALGSMSLHLKPQVLPFDHPDSHYMFQHSVEKPLVATVGATQMYKMQVMDGLLILQKKALEHNGLNHIQVFEDPSKPEPLWFVEDDPEGCIWATLPWDY
jgi:hypothetical protein